MPFSNHPNSGSLTEHDLKARVVELLRQRSEHWAAARSECISNGEYICPFSLEPRPLSSLPDAFPEGASEQELNSFTSRTGVTLPQCLRKWLTITNGAGGFFGVRPRRNEDSIEHEWDEWSDLKDHRWIPVAADDFGNRYVQLFPSSTTDPSPVCYVEMIGRELSYVVASDMLHFALFKLEDELGLHNDLAKTKKLEAFVPKSKLRRGATELKLPPWPFSRSYMLFRDPQIANVKGLPFAWD